MASPVQSVFDPPTANTLELTPGMSHAASVFPPPPSQELSAPTAPPSAGERLAFDVPVFDLATRQVRAVEAAPPGMARAGARPSVFDPEPTAAEPVVQHIVKLWRRGAVKRRIIRR
jgi:hypothetical protein